MALSPTFSRRSTTHAGARNNPDAERRIAALLAGWRRTGRPVIHVQHMSREADSLLRPGLPGVNSAFIGTGLEEHLRARGIDALVLVGITTDHCVSTTARMAANLGFATVVVADATATFERTGHDGERFTADQMHRLALASLHGEFATIRESGALLADLGTP